MKITKNSAGLSVGVVVVLPSEETLIIRAVCREPDGIYYRVQFGEFDGDDFVPTSDIRVMGHYELIGAEIE